MITRCLTTLVLVFLTAMPSMAERPRPLGWALDAMRAGNWTIAAQLAAKDGDVAHDVIEWSRLRAGAGSFADVHAFLERRPNWPGERLLRRRSERAVIRAGDDVMLAFFKNVPPQTPDAALAYGAALTRNGAGEQAQLLIRQAWETMPMNATSQALFLGAHATALKPHHSARLDNMLWDGAFENARRMLALVSKADVATANARMALRKREKNVDGLIAKIPKSHAATPGLLFERFAWRRSKGRTEEEKSLLRAVSTSAAALGRPQEWSNRRRTLARDEMRNGDPERAYEIAARHFLTTGSNYADLEWLAGYIALQKLNEPETALQHFENHNNAVASPISKGRAGYWRGRAMEAMGNVAGADQAYTDAAQYQTSFYGLLAADRAELPFDDALAAEVVEASWRTSEVAQMPLFQAGLLLQASGEIDLAERFWTHLAESLPAAEVAFLAQAAVDVGQPHLAVMVGKRAARRAIVVPGGYYALHPVAEQNLPMAPEMVLAIARRESEFDPVVQSGVGARGLMQIMPATGREVAASLGRSFEHTTERLTADPVYNAELGAAYLATLAHRFRGNVIMMSAGYNAGPSRPDRWMQQYGDPRKSDVDIVDWIEHIPFRETRNYVMRVSESLPIYRAALGKDPVPIPFIEEISGSSLLAFAPKGE